MVFHELTAWQAVTGRRGVRRVIYSLPTISHLPGQVGATRDVISESSRAHPTRHAPGGDTGRGVVSHRRPRWKTGNQAAPRFRDLADEPEPRSLHASSCLSARA